MEDLRVDDGGGRVRGDETVVVGVDGGAAREAGRGDLRGDEGGGRGGPEEVGAEEKEQRRGGRRRRRNGGQPTKSESHSQRFGKKCSGRDPQKIIPT